MDLFRRTHKRAITLLFFPVASALRAGTAEETHFQGQVASN